MPRSPDTEWGRDIPLIAGDAGFLALAQMPVRSPPSALVAEQHGHDRLIDAVSVGKATPLWRFIVVDFRC